MSRMHCLRNWPPGPYHPARITPAVLSLCPAPHCTPVVCAAHISQVGTPSLSLPSLVPAPGLIGSPSTHGICLPPPTASLRPSLPPASSLFCKCFPRSLWPCASPWRLPCLPCSSPAPLAVALSHLPSVFVAELALLRTVPLLHVQFPSLAPLSLFLATPGWALPSFFKDTFSEYRI